jgi:hypothetical protein
MAVGIRLAQSDVAGAIAAVQGDPLLWIIFSAPLFLGAFAALGGRKQDEVAALNSGLEATVAARTAELAGALTEVGAARAAQEALLAALEVGLVSFGADGRLSSARSAALGRLLPESLGAHTIEGLLAQSLEVPAETTAAVRELLWDEAFWSPFDDTVAMLPDRWEREGRALELSFRPVPSPSGALLEVLVQVLDRTEARQAEREHAAAKARIDRLSAASRSVDGYLRYRREVSGLLDAIGAVAGPEHSRPLHTIKGLTRIFSFHEVAALVHQIEDQLAAGGRAPMAAVQALFAEQATDIATVLGIAEGQETIAVDRLAFRALLARVDRGTATAMRGLTLRPAADRLVSHAEAAVRLASRLERAVALNIEGDGLCDGELDPFEGPLTHVLTNAVCHAAREDSVLHINLRVERGERLRIVVEDDGGGIDTARLVARAVASGRWTAERAARASMAEQLGLVFAEGLSAKDAVSAESGRGVGLSAARADMNAAGGDLTAQHGSKGGACFVLEAPLATAGRERAAAGAA